MIYLPSLYLQYLLRKNFAVLFPCISWRKSWRPSLPLHCNFYLPDICSFSINNLPSLKVAGSREVYSTFKQPLMTIKWPHDLPATPPTHHFSAPYPATLPVGSWSHPTHNWLLKPVHETPPDPLSTCKCIIILFETTLIWTILTKHTVHCYKAWVATPHQPQLLDCPSIVL